MWFTSVHGNRNFAPSRRRQNWVRRRGYVPRLEALEDRCLLSSSPIGVVRRDYFVETISTLPHYYGLPAQLDVHEVAPV